MQRKKLPTGRTTFREIRDPKENFIYIDKTEMALSLINGTKFNFLSRPRRFGKSLFVDTLSEIFKGNKPLFEGLHIYDKWDWETQFPVIKIDFTVGDFSTKEGLISSLKTKFESNYKRLKLNDLDFSERSPGDIFELLIERAFEKYNRQVVILIDEYDKPILDNISLEKKEMATVARDVLRNFYSTLKASDQYLRFVFLTGVSKFSKMNLFSGLNNLTDITLHKDYATITGYTQHDIETEFAEYFDDVDMETVRRWYNGYNWFGEPVYNPYDILLFLEFGGEFRNYWWETGSPRFLIEKLKEGNYFLPNLENIKASEETLNSFDVEYIDLGALLWQTGYLTFDSKVSRSGRISYKMKVPNQEVQISLNSLFFDYLTNFKNQAVTKQNNVYDALEAGEMEDFRNELHALFAAIPHENYVRNTIASYEGYYASVMFAFMASVGFEIKTEEPTNHGRIDMTLIGPSSIFILEFKVDMPAEAALHQIETKKYYEKYTSEGKDIFLIGIHFSSDERNIVGFEWKKM